MYVRVQALQGLRGLGLGPLSYEWCLVQASLVRELQRIARGTEALSAAPAGDTSHQCTPQHGTTQQRGHISSSSIDTARGHVPHTVSAPSAAAVAAVEFAAPPTSSPHNAATTTKNGSIPLSHNEGLLSALASTAGTVAATHSALPRAHMLPLLHALSAACCAVLSRPLCRDGSEATTEYRAAPASCAPRLLLSMCNLGMLGPAAPEGAVLQVCMCMIACTCVYMRFCFTFMFLSV